LNRLLRLLLSALCVAAAAGAQDLRVQYLDGLLEVQSGGGWRQARLGELVSGGASVRLAPGSLAELAAGELRLTLHQPGTFAVSALLASGRQSLAWGLGRLLKTRLRTLFSAPVGASASTGTRAWEALDRQAELEMMGDEEEEARKAAARAEQAAAADIRELLAAGRAGEAAETASRVLQKAGPESRAYFRFLLASARSLEGNQAAAVQALGAEGAPREAPWYPEYALLEARLLLEGQAYARALAALDGLLAAHPQAASAQPAWFLSAFCCLQLGDRAQARRRLERALALEAGSEIGIQAKEMLNSL